MVGRDIGTVVMPDADLKIYLDASLRRGLAAAILSCWSGGMRGLRTVLRAMRRRDAIDSHRAVAPLRLLMMLSG